MAYRLGLLFFILYLTKNVVGVTFPNDQESFSGVEEQAVNTTYGTITGITGGTSVTYTILGGNEVSGTTGFFKLEGTDTELKILNDRVLDYEGLSSAVSDGGNIIFKLTIQANDSNGNKDSAHVVISVTNDGQCALKLSNDDISLLEKSDTATEFYEFKTALPYSPLNTNYEIAPDNNTQEIKDKFEFTNANDGHIRLKAGAIWDYEASDIVKIVVRCTKGPLNFLTASYDARSYQVLIIYIQDVNDNSNVFGKSSYSAVVDENTAAGVLITTVTATDADNTTSKAGTYYYVAGNQFSSLFTLNTTTGEIYSTGNLDYETATSYTMTVCATDNATDATQTVPSTDIRTSCVPLIISLNDLNDNKPTFANAPYTITVSEKVPIGRDVFTFVATDADSGVNGQVEYVAVSMNSTLFTLDSATGAINITSALDYETATSHTIVVYAMDKGTTPDKSVNVTLTINVADVNDLNPVFNPNILKYNVIEGTDGYLTKVFATDNDGTTPNNNLVYTLIDPSGSGVIIVSTDGNVTIKTNGVTDTLDRESVDHYEFLIVATDTSTDASEQRQASAIFILDVLDKNDNAPVLGITSDAVLVSEQIPVSSSIYSFTATDADSSSTIKYYAANTNDPDWSFLSLNETTGDITTTATFNYETQSFYQVHVMARDEGNLNSSIGYLNVTIANSDTIDLVFEKSRYHYNTDEGSKFPFLPVMALSEVPKATGENLTLSTVRYYMVPDTQKQSETFFRIESTTGQIFFLKDLDFEVERYYTFEVIAVDESGKYGNATTLVVIDINDQNDVSPVLHANSQSVSIRENSDIGQVVAVFRVDDIDTETEKSGGLFYFNTSSMADIPFKILKINASTAYMVVGQHPLDRELQSFYEVDVYVEDGKKNPSNTLRINITITDANDNNPIFNKPLYTYEVLDNVAIGTSVGRVNASDADSTAFNSDLVYSLYNPDGHNLFAVDPNTGVISVNATLTVLQDTTYVYKVYAKDRINTTDTTYQRSGSSLIRFTVKRTLNEAPQLTQSGDTIVISEKYPLNIEVYIVRATDREDLPFVFKYSRNNTINPDNDAFILDPNGNIQINPGAKIDREKKSQYTLYVQAEELIAFYGSKLNSAEFPLIINIADVNDNSPKFLSDAYTFSVDENSASATVFGRVYAYDNDSTSPNNMVRYVLGNNMYANLFAVNETSGEIYIVGNLDRETQSVYFINIVATDNATDAEEVVPSDEARIGTTLVRIDVLDKNDNDPMFLNAPYTITVSEKVPVGRDVFTFVATDADSGVNGQVEYVAVSMNSTLFTLDSATGAINITSALDYETATSHTIVVYAMDKGARKSSNVTLTINVADVNDLNPVFNPNILRYNVTEGTDGYFTTVAAVDTDGTSPNKDIVYTLIDPFQSGVIIVHTDGNVTIKANGVTNTLDRESVDHYEFLVVATDMSVDESERRSAAALFILDVLDVNDNPPVFGQTVDAVIISEYSPIGSSIFEFHATDADSTSVVTYAPVDATNANWNKFDLNMTTGDVTVKGLTTSGQCTLQVYATDGMHNSTMATLNIKIEKANNSLQYVSDRYHYELFESFPTFFTTLPFDISFEKNIIKAVAPENLTTIRYYMLNDTKDFSQNKFRVDPLTGAIFLYAPLDYETQRYYAFTVEAVDISGKYLNATTLVVIDVLDVTDVNPQLSVTANDFNLTENPAVGEVVAVLFTVDVDTETEKNSGGLIYSIQSDTPVPFMIYKSSNQKTAYVVVTQPADIDRELVSEYNFNVTVHDSKKNPSNVVPIKITIIDNNDNNPIFQQPQGYVFTISETDALSSVIGTVTATDRDVSVPYNTITYSVMGNIESANIIINATSGQISINSSIDYEQMKHYDFSIIASDSAMPDTYKRKTAVPVRIDVIDVNDNAPVFNGPANFSIYEDVAVSMHVFTLSATDADSGNHGVFTFSSMDTSPFMVKPSGEIILTAGLDYEVKQLYQMTVVANDTGGLETKRNITIHVLNVDDNRPTFLQPLGYATSVSETSVPGENNVLLTVSATDADLNTFNKVSYQIMNPFENIASSVVFPFKVNATTGAINLAFPLDRENRDLYQFIVKASDDGNPALTNAVFVNITVTDENDNNPKFSMPCYNVTISDATIVGGTVRVVSASDMDIGMNGEIIFSLVDPSGHFAIDNTTGAVYVANHLYYKTRNSYLLQVVATDRGTPSRNATSKVAIELSAMKNYPTTVTDISIVENTALAGTKLVLVDVMTLAVTDAHVYEIEFLNQTDSSSYFSINSTNGCITLLKDFDHETIKQHIFLRKASVNGYVIGEQTVFINIIDSNDNDPYFFPSSMSQVVNISENSEVGQIVAVFKGYDPDESDREKLSFDVQSVTGYSFGQTSNNGTLVLFLTGELDAEFGQSLELNVQITDTKRSTNTKLTINIIDENDNSPMFNSTEYVFQKSEGVTQDPFVGRVFATDNDVTLFRNDINYRIVDADVQGAFEIFSNGTINCKRPLDREQVSMYAFTVEAYNTDTVPSRIGVALVKINVLDVNDNTPVCHGPTSYIFPENEPLGSTLFIINATDADAGENGRLTYKILSNGGLPITIDPVTGTVQLLGPMDYDTGSNSKGITVLIEISDNGSPANTVIKTYPITLVDVNDNKPFFDIRPELKYVQVISENIPIGSSVIQTFAQDADSGLNAKITYSIYESFGNLPFNISDTGLITTNGPIDREAKDFYQFFITATDGGSPALSDTILVEVTITDQNDNDPIFENLYYNISLAEGTPQGFSVLQVMASDKDINTFGQICYGVYNQTDSGIFQIDRVTGVVSTTQKIKVAPAKYRIIANATDKDANNPRSSPAQVIIDIEVLPLEVIAPQFITPYITYSIAENSGAGRQIGVTTAHGEGIKYQVVYDDTDRPNARKFLVIASGSIFQLEPLDYEKVKSFSFSVNARNIYNVNATQNIFIKVLDEDDNAPQWNMNKTQQLTATITDETHVGQIVANVAATDVDTVSHNQLKFSLINDYNGIFDVISHQDVGSIVVKKDVRFFPRVYLLEVEVTDPAGHKAPTRCQVVVNVIRPDLPVFPSSLYIFPHPERGFANAPVGTVSASGVPNMRYYFLTDQGEASSNAYFNINEFTGAITTRISLNIELLSRHDFVVVAHELNSIRRAVVPVTVMVSEVNEFAPVFTSPTNYYVTEFVPTGSSFIQLHAHDDDLITNKITYSYVNSSLPLLLTVNQATGSVSYGGGFNFERQETVTITFMAVDNGLPTPKKTYHVVTVAIKNINEYNPLFTIRLQNQDTYLTEKPESLAPGSSIITVTATDDDAGLPGQVEYYIADTVEPIPFVINKVSGEISLGINSRLDYETRNYYELLVVAKDLGWPARTDAIVVAVRVLDVNDNAPIFNPQVYRLTLSDNTNVGTDMCAVRATDIDSPVNAGITYTITGGSGINHFAVNPTTGVISLKKAIDFANVAERSFSLSVIASNGNTVSSVTPASIFIDVVQSEIPKAPYFTQDIWVVSFKEDQGQNQLLAVNAINPSGGPLSFKIINNTQLADEDNFFATPTRGNLYLIKKLDYEKQRRHDFNMRVDCTTTGLYSLASFSIFVEDVNDNLPYFVAPLFRTVHINERSNSGQEVTRIEAHDLDVINQGNFFFRLNTPNVPFTIISTGNEAVVYTSGNLENIAQSVYVLEFTVFDKKANGDLENEASQKFYLTVNVTRNDKRYPQFGQISYTFSFPENNAVPYNVGTVQASRVNTYKLIDANNDFTINSNGQIFAQKSFDYEVDRSYQFTVMAKNPVNNFTSFVPVNVFIQNLNDNIPQFVGRSIYNVSENAPSGSFMFHVDITDGDYVAIPKTFRITSQTSGFTINQNTGDIYLTGTLDYETAVAHQIVIEVTDGSQKNSQTFTIYVINENDNKPIFPSDPVTVSIHEKDSPSHLLTVTATDQDAGLFGQLTYRIDTVIPETIFPFAVQPQSGKFFQIKNVDYEKVKEYSVLVIAEDGGSPPRIGMKRINVIIVDDNDNVPMFSSAVYEAIVVEIAPVGTSLIQVHATDIDTAKYNIVDYQIQSGNTDLFRVDSATGVVYTKGVLDHETVSYYELVIRAVDQERPNVATANTAMVKITVTDANEDQPTFATPTQIIKLAENTQKDLRIGNSRAVDTDSTFKTITYAIAQSGDYTHFSIDSTSGDLTLRSFLDYETKKSYEFTVVATDNGGLEGRQTIFVTVHDVNDNAPRFINMVNQTYTISKYVPANQVIAMLNAADDDLVSQGKLTMSIVTNNANSPFTIVTNGHTGAISVREGTKLSIGFYVIQVSVSDGQFSSQHNAYVSLTVRQPPSVEITFNKQPGSTFTAKENSQNHIFGPVEATVKDNIAPIAYRIWEQNVPFKINSVNGQLSQNGAYDFEVTEDYLFHVAAGVTLDGITYTALSSVYVIIEDINDNTPVLTGPTSVTVQEDIQIGKEIFTVSATDGDAPDTPNSAIQYSITGSEKFTINPISGAISVIQSLDYETEVSYQVSVTAFDKGNPVRSASKAYTINVADSNDNRPSFAQTSNTASIREDSSTQNRIICITATDADKGLNGQIEYELLSAESTNTEKFVVATTTGCIYYVGEDRQLDREVKTQYEFLLKATDKGTPRLSGFSNVVIVVLDVNDNTPLFANSLYNLQLSDKTTVGTEIIRLTATDADMGTNGEVVLSIIGGNLGGAFQLGSSGKLQTAAALDANTVPENFALTIKAEDKAPSSIRRSSTITVNIAILDSSNVVLPVFGQTAYTTTISELQAANVGFLTVQATISGGEAVSYSILDCSVKTSGKIAISEAGSITLLQQLDYEQVQSASFFVKAFSKANPDSGYSTALVTITITDINDNRPIFQRTTYQTSLARDSKVGSVIVNVVATDADTSVNGVVRYQFEANSQNTDLFAVNRITGDVSTRRALQKADIKNYQMRILAHDEGTPQLQSTQSAVVSINVYPDNMFRPVITNTQQLTSLTVSENQGAQVVATVQARDEDSDLSSATLAERPTASNFGAITFIILPTAGVIPFTIASNGQISVTGPLDRETKSSYEFYVQARDGGSPYRSSTARVFVSVGDVNEIPQFVPQLYTVTVSEATPRGVSVIQVTAVDKDLGASGTVVYSLVSGNTGTKFAIDANTGIISLSDVLNFNNQQTYQLKVRATDGSLVANPDATVTVTVAEASGTGGTTPSPVFELSFYNYQNIFENSGSVTLGNVKATLSDGGSVSYSIESQGDASFFSVNAQGTLSFTGGDYEVKREYTAVVKATNNANTNFFAFSTVRVQLGDVNDNTPIVLNPNAVVSIKENSAINTLVYTSYATDLDSGVNGKLTFNFVTASNTFSIDTSSNTGIIRLKANVDREVSGSYSLQIRVTDGGSPQKSAQQTLTVTIVDQNDNNPHPVNGQFSHSMTIQQNFVQGNTLYTIAYSDADDGVNGQLEYILSAASTSNVFTVESDGRVRLTGALLPTVQEYILYVSVRDRGTPARSSPFTLTIQTPGGVSGTPSFSPINYNFMASEDVTVESIIGHLNIIDSDLVADTYTYTIKSGNTANTFEVLSNGNLKVKQPLDRETTSIYRLSVSVTDRTGNNAPQDAAVEVSVGDVNDNNPSFNQAAYTFDVLENYAIGNAQTGPFARTVQATDADTGNNALVVYTIIDASQTFNINNNGRIYLLKALDYASIKQYNILVRASDSGSSARHTTVPLTINVGDVNAKPVFTPASYTADISEVAAVGTSVISVTVIDQDMPPNNNRVTLTIQSGNTGNKFRIQENVIFLNGNVDFEATNRYTLVISASDAGNPSLAASPNAQVVINVQPANDNQPNFGSERYQATVLEGPVTSDPILTVVATDLDNGGSMSYFLDNTADAQSFNIITQNQQGLIYVKNALDYETKKQYSFTVRAEDNDGNSLGAKALVVVDVTDKNDNKPIFQSKSYTFTVDDQSPIGTMVGSVLATDLDSGVNAQIEYFFASNAIDFDLQQNYLIVKNSLDYTKRSVYTFSIGAIDKQSQLNAVEASSITINVKPTTGTPPVFSQSFYNVTVVDNVTTADTIATVQAVDSDGSGFSAISYSLVPSVDSHLFQIADSRVGAITLKLGQSLSARNQIRHVLIVNAVDNVGKSSQTYVIIHVIGIVVQAERPTFVVTDYFGVATDQMLAGASLITVYAVDPQADRLTYTIESGNSDNLFVLSTNGNLQLRVPFTYDANRPKTYTLLVQATDATSLKTSQPAKVIISLHYLSPDSPAFSVAEYTQSLDENKDPAAIFQVVASFGNANVQGELRYKIVYNSQVRSTDFDVNVADGEISALKKFDRETKSQYVFEVEAYNSVQPSSNDKVLVTININDVNDVIPSFGIASNTVQAKVQENAPADTEVVCVKATDGDSGVNGQIVYSLVNDFNLFKIDPTTGVITTQKALNYESDGASKNLQVRASDSGTTPQSAILTVIVAIGDVNDVRPVFKATSYQTSLAETNDLVTSVLKVEATDTDFLPVVYRIISEDNTLPFAIGRTNGIISSSKPIDYESKQRYELCVEAYDSTNPHLSSMTTVTITVTDVNDNPPIAVKEEYRVMVSEAAQVGELVAVVKATDADSGNNGQVLYSISSGNTLGVFEINNEGIIKIAASLDYEGSTKTYILAVEAEDNVASPAKKRLAKSITVIIDVQNVNDNSPTILPASSSISIPEGVSDRLVTTLTSVTDLDAGDTFTLSLVNYNDDFVINTDTKQIKTKRALNYDIQPKYTLVVKATDQGGRIGLAVVTVSLQNQNNAPTFPSTTSYALIVPENQPLNSIVGVFMANDQDSGNNGQLTYTITAGNDNNKFSIISNGIVKLNALLAVTKYTLTIKAEDGGSPKLSTTVQVTIDVTKVDIGTCNNGTITGTVTFSQTKYAQTVAENVDIANALVTVSASATGSIGSVEYLIEDPSSMFRVDATGKVFAKSAFDYESKKEYSVCVVAKGLSTNAITDSTTVHITVTNFNDVVPVFVSDLTSFAVPSTYLTNPFAAVVATTPGFNVTYSIQTDGNTGSHFEINAGNGAISLIKSPVATQTFSMTIRATSGSNTKDLAISVAVEKCSTGSTCTAPVFNQPLYTKTMDETRATGVDIITVKATGNNLQYSILEADAGRYFTIDATTAIIKNLRPLDFESIPTHSFGVKVVDTVSGLVNVATVVVTLQNIDDEQPRFAGNFSVSIPREWPLRVSFVDANTVEGLNITYSINPAVDGFVIDSRSGSISFEKTQNAGIYKLKVQAENLFGVDFTWVTVDLQDSSFQTAPLAGQTANPDGTLKVTIDPNIFFAPLPVPASLDFIVMDDDNKQTLVIEKVLYPPQATTKRKRRAAGQELTVTFGTDTECLPGRVCNAPLSPGKTYRILMRGSKPDGTVVYSKLGSPDPIAPVAQTGSSMDTLLDKTSLNYNYVVGLIVMATFIVICVTAIAILLCYKSSGHMSGGPYDRPDGAGSMSNRPKGESSPGGPRHAQNRAYVADDHYPDSEDSDFQMGDSPEAKRRAVGGYSQPERSDAGQSTFVPAAPPPPAVSGQLRPQDAESQEISMDMDQGRTEQTYIMKRPGETSYGESAQPPRPGSTTQPRLTRTNSGRVILQHVFKQ